MQSGHRSISRLQKDLPFCSKVLKSSPPIMNKKIKNQLEFLSALDPLNINAQKPFIFDEGLKKMFLLNFVNDRGKESKLSNFLFSNIDSCRRDIHLFLFLVLVLEKKQNICLDLS